MLQIVIRFSTTIVCTFILGLPIAFSDSPPEYARPEAPRTQAVRTAGAKYDLALRRARETYFKALVAADKDYISVLTDSENLAMRKGISEKAETDRLEAARLAAIEAFRLHKEGTAAGLMTVTSAKWGANGSWVDVTDKVRSHIKDGSLQIATATGDFPDPAPNILKELQVDVRCGQSVIRLVAPQLPNKSFLPQMSISLVN